MHYNIKLIFHRHRLAPVLPHPVGGIVNVQLAGLGHCKVFTRCGIHRTVELDKGCVVFMLDERACGDTCASAAMTDSELAKAHGIFMRSYPRT